MLDRLETLIGSENIDKLNKITVLIVGLGGVGGYTLESLIRSGIGKVIIVDSDTIDITNLNRQIIANKESIGYKKVDEWEKRINSISNTEVIKIDEFITKDNIEILFKEKIDYIIDACDTIDTKFELIKEALNRNIKIISSMGTARKMNPEMLKITNIWKTDTDPIAKILRKKLKDNHINDKIMVVSSSEKPITNKLGSNSFVPAVAGLLCTSYIINDIVGDIND